jgi:hypothetical protein
MGKIKRINLGDKVRDRKTLGMDIILVRGYKVIIVKAVATQVSKINIILDDLKPKQ